MTTGSTSGPAHAQDDRQRRPAVVRRRLVCRGTVQGVGFRPSVHRLATSLGLGGWVRNDPDGALIEIEGNPDAVASFEEKIVAALPALARLHEVTAECVPVRHESTFRVQDSTQGARRGALIPPDTLLCNDCRAEMEDPADRRHRYPFTTCTACGPRYSLARTLPYDRERTSMACFALCEDCRAEYEDPASRRFHAEPICCPACGPELWLAGPDGTQLARGQDALRRARESLTAGAILAVKGVGGFQLACRADDSAVVGRLRARKRRPTKPVAVMVPEIRTAHELLHLTEDDAALLDCAAAPILLAPRRATSLVADLVAPGITDLGVMLPTAPLHVELLREAPYPALVMTSGNSTDEPICKENREACARLRDIADAFLLHDRDVVRRIDDSVVRSSGAGPLVIRRSRGWVPEPMPLPIASPAPVLALGGFLQTTACVAVGGEAFLSQHIGDLETELARDYLGEVAECLEDFLQVRSQVVAVDLHPDYPSAWKGEQLAVQRGGRLLPVQHHLAHAAAVLAEHACFPAPGERVAALVLDGTGWGTDGTAWGCECLLLDGELRWQRAGRATPFPLVGGERAVRAPWRVAAALLAQAEATHLLPALPLSRHVPQDSLLQVAALAGNGAWPVANGAGRLFEAAGALMGCCTENEWEGEAAVRFESLAEACDGSVPPWPEVSLPMARAELPAAALLASAAARIAAGEDLPRAARGFHVTFCRLAGLLARQVIPPDVRRIALGGGCLVNRLLRVGLVRELIAAGFEPLLPCRIPAGDGGLSYGQATLAAVSLARQRSLQEGSD